MESSWKHGRRSSLLTRKESVGLALVFGALGALLGASGCSDNPTTPGGSGGSGGESASASTGTSTSTSSGAGGGMTGPVPAELVAAFDPLGQLPEGLVIDGTTAYVSFSVLHEVWKVDLVTKTATMWATVPGTLGSAFAQGLAMDAQKNVLVALQSLDIAVSNPGIYKIGPAGGTATMFAQAQGLNFPRSITMSPFNTMFVTAPDPGRVYQVSMSGTVTEMAVKPNNVAFGWDPASMCLYGMASPMGITSMVVTGANQDVADYYWLNADRAELFLGLLGVDPNGDPQLQEIVPALNGPDCATLGGGEGLIKDPKDDTFLYASRQANKIMRRTKDGDLVVLSEGAGIDAPSATAIAEIDGKRYLYFTNSAYKDYNKGGIPSLSRIPLTN